MTDNILTWGSILLVAVVVLWQLLSLRLHRPEKPVDYKILRRYQDEKCRPVLIVQAPSSRDASRVIEGMTYPGDVSWRQTYLGGHQYKLDIVDFDLDARPEKVRR